MHDDDPSQNDEATERARFLLSQSEKALDEVLFVFDSLSERLRTEGEPNSPEVMRAVTAMSQARSRLINEVKEHDKRVIRSEGRDAEAPLDLDAIRAEIGRRIDRIRAALDAGEVSEGTDH